MYKITSTKYKTQNLTLVERASRF